MEKAITLNKNMVVFGYKFEKGSRIILNRDVLEITFGDDKQNITLPLICLSYGKTSLEFMSEILKQNN